MSFDLMYRFLTSVGAFVAVIGIAVFIHELGHFLFAKKFGIKVFSFSIGFPPTIWKKTYGGTDYKIGLIPLGGYVKMSGEDPSEERTGAHDEFSSKPVWQRAVVIVAGPLFNIILGYFLAVGICFTGLESPGFLPKVGIIADDSPAKGILQVGDVIEKANGQTITSWFEYEKIVRKSENTPVNLTIRRETEVMDVTLVPKSIIISESYPLLSKMQIRVDSLFMGNGTLEMAPWIDPVIGEMKEDGAAYLAGIKEGDRIISINDSPVLQWSGITNTITSIPVPPPKFVARERWWKGKVSSSLEKYICILWPDTAIRRDTVPPLSIVLIRNNETMTISVSPKISFTQRADGSIAQFMAIGVMAATKTNPQTLLHSFASAAIMTVRLGNLVLVTLKKLIANEISPKLLAGPLGIAQGSGASFREGGVKQLVYFLALISINLGVVNLIPFPLLDGGWLFIFLLYESIRRKPIPQKIQKRLIDAGMIALLALIFYITYNDLGRIIGYQTVEEVIIAEEKR